MVDSDDMLIPTMPARGWQASGCLVVLLVLSCGRAASAQITSASVSGIIRDQTGAALPGVAVTVKNLETQLTRAAVTADDGSYSIAGLPPGLYEARAVLQGFATALHTGLVLAVAQQASLNLTMKVGASEALTVVGTQALVDVKTSALSSLVDEKTIEQLPLNGRNFIDLALLQPGVVAFSTRGRAGPSGRGQQIDINGANGRANSYLLDGANMSGYGGLAVANAADTTLGLDTIREFRVVTNAFPADYGRAMGGVVSVITKSGTNEFRGSAFEFFRNDTLDARNYFDDEKPAFERHQFGSTASGPVRKNRTFFFGGVEWLVENLGVTQVTEVPTMAARSGSVAPAVRPYLDLFPPPNGPDQGADLARFSFPFDRTTRETFLQGRLDHNVSSTSAFFVRYTFDDATRRQPTLLPQFATDQISHSQWLTLEEKRTVTGALLNTARFSYSRVNLAAELVNDVTRPELAFVPGQTVIGNLVIASREFGPERTNPQHQDVDFFTLSDDVTYQRGRHMLKAGMMVERAHTTAENSTNVRGRFIFPTVKSFLEGAPSRFTGVLPGYQVNRTRRNTTFGFYVQDDLAAHARVTVNLGVRYEFYTVPNDTEGRDSTLRNVLADKDFTVGSIFENPSLKNIGPRIGLAWDVSGDGRTAIRAGFGVYYDTDGPFNAALLAAAFSPPFAASVNVANPAFPNPSLNDERAARGVDYHMRQPRMLSGNVTFEREIVSGLVATAGYAGSRGYNLVQAIEANPTVPEVSADGRMFFPENAPRRNPNWESIEFRTAAGHSWYDALQLAATKRFGNGYGWHVAYTLGKVVDETQGQIPGDATNSSVFPQNPIDPRSDRGPADFDVRHVLAMSVTWELAHGWQVNALGTLRSGVPFSPAIQAQRNWSRSGNVAQSAEDRPNVRPGVRLEDIVLGGPARYFDPSAFELQPRGFLGNAGRNMLTGPGLVMFNASLIRDLRWSLLGANGGVELRLEAFNVFNRANFGIPNRVVFSGASAGEAPLPTAGQITTTATDARQVQLGVKIKF